MESDWTFKVLAEREREQTGNSCNTMPKWFCTELAADGLTGIRVMWPMKLAWPTVQRFVEFSPDDVDKTA